MRPIGVKKGVSTKSFYKAIGYKKPDELDVRDVIGTLTLSATIPSDTTFLAALSQCLGIYNPDKLYLEIRKEKNNEIVYQTFPQPEEEEPSIAEE